MKIRNILAAVGIAGFLWVAASFFDTNANNMGSRRYAPWNVFAMAAGAEPVAGSGKEAGEAVEPDRLHTEGSIMLLARLIEAENGSAPHDETLCLTGVCALKRVKSPCYPDTLEGVIYQEGSGGRAYSTAPGLEKVVPSERSLEIAEELLVYGVDEYPDTLVFQAMFPQGKRVYRKLDGEYFCLAE